MQDFRNGYSICILVVFQQRSNDSGQRQRTSVKRVHQLKLALFVGVTGFQPVGLKRFKI